jgi:hypothetical protein
LPACEQATFDMQGLYSNLFCKAGALRSIGQWIGWQRGLADAQQRDNLFAINRPAFLLIQRKFHG